MKRILSVFLALTMIFSCVSFAAPAMVGTVGNSAEDVQEQTQTAEDAVVSEETQEQGIYDDTYGLLLAKMDFENLEVGTKVKNGKLVSDYGYITPDLPENFPSTIAIHNSFAGSEYTVKVDENGNKYGYGLKRGNVLNEAGEVTTYGDGWCKAGFMGYMETDNGGYAAAMPQGVYTLKATVKILTKNGEPTSATNTVTNNYSSTTYLATSTGWGQENNYLGKDDTGTTNVNKLDWNICHKYSFVNGGSYVLNTGKTQEFCGVSVISTMFDGGNALQLEVAIDNLELYYKPAVEITFNNGGVADTTLPSTTYLDNLTKKEITVNKIWVEPGKTVDFSKYAPTNTATKLFNCWRDENGNSIPNNAVFTQDTTLYAEWLDAYDSNYGQLIASLDFEKYSLGTSISTDFFDLSTIGTVTDNLPKGFPEKIYFNRSGEGATIVGTENDKYFSLYQSKTKSTGKQSWPRVQFRSSTSGTDSTNLFPAGQYTFIWSTKQDTEKSVNCTYSTIGSNLYHWHPDKKDYNEMNGGFNKKAATELATSEKEGWTTTYGIASRLFGEKFTLSDAGGYDNSITDKEELNAIRTIDFSGYAAFQAMPTVTAVAADDPNAATKTYSFKSYTFIDNVKLYYKAPITLTLEDPKGYSENLPETVITKPDTSYTFITPTTSQKNVSFMGWSTEENGDIITGTFAPTKDMTLYPIWAEVETHPQYGKTLFNIDFENSKDFSNSALYRHGYVNPDDPVAKTWYMSNGSFQAGSIAIYGENKDGVVVSKNGVKVETEGVTDYTVVNKFLGAGGATSTNPQFVPTTKYDGSKNFDVFAPKGYFTLSSRTAYDLHEDYSHTISDTTAYQFRHYTFAWKDEERTTTTFKHDSLVTFKDVISESKGDNIWKNHLSHNYNKNTDFVVSSITLAEKVNGVSVNNTYTDIKETHSLFRFLIYFTYKNRTVDAKKDLFKLDDVVLYWKPFTATLTIDMVEDNGLTLAGLTDYDTINAVSLNALLDGKVNSVYNGRVFKGLSRTQGGELISGDFYLVEDTTLYAVWSDDFTGTAPTSYNENSIRTDAVPGIRFKASVTTAQREIAEEYGFIVTRSSILTKNSLTPEGLTFNMPEKTYASGKSYIKNTDNDYIYEILTDGVLFTGVFKGIPATKANYEEEIVARPYIKYADGTIVYGVPKSRSILSVAENIRDGGYENMTQTAIDRVQDILEVCGVPNEKGALLTANGDNGQIYAYCKADGTTSQMNGSISFKIVKDPLNTGRDNVYFVDGTNYEKNGLAGSGPHNYIYYKDLGFEAGKTYVVTYDILAYKYDSAGNDITDKEKTKYNTVTGSSNFIYTDDAKDANGNPIKNHTSNGSYTSYTDKWTTYSHTIKISDTYDPSKENYWSLFASPKAYTTTDQTTEDIKYTRSFYIDNIRLVEVTE